MGYGVVLISHAQDKVFTDESGQEFNKIVPTLGNTPRKIALRFCDIIGYARIVNMPEKGEQTLLYMRAKTRFEAGSRFKYTPDFIEFNYQNIVNAIVDAIEKQAQESAEYVTDERQDLDLDKPKKDWETVLKDFRQLTEKLVEKGVDKVKIRTIIEEKIGKGKTAADLYPNDLNAETVEMIIEELETL